jgi:hypothetical protein
MALGFYFTPSGFTPAKYDETLARLEAAEPQVARVRSIIVG